jgi:RNA polymerase sigma-70 factor (ECF subfamily)
MNRSDEAARAAERVARESYGRLVAYLAARTRDVAGAEDALGEAFAAALRMWPVDGVPANPDAWLLTVARRRQTDALRRRQTRQAGEEHVKLIADEIEAAADSGGAIPDRRLALMFACAHPEVERGMRAPLILQTILGLTSCASSRPGSRLPSPISLNSPSASMPCSTPSMPPMARAGASSVKPKAPRSSTRPSGWPA